MPTNKIAVLGMDLEEWYHLDYINDVPKEHSEYSMLDGFNNFLEITESNNIKSTIFTVADIAYKLKKDLQWANSNNYEIASHGLSHKRPLTLTKNEFVYEIKNSKLILEQIIQNNILGYRAPCFSIDSELIDLLIRNNYSYDSSKIDFKYHPLYGNFTLNDFIHYSQNIYVKKTFVEFEIPTIKIFNKNIPFSGGGYLRLFPLKIVKYFINQMAVLNKPIFFYIHPFELSNKVMPILNLSFKNQFRMKIGRNKMKNKLDKIIKYLLKNNWKIITFKEYYESIVKR